MNGFNLSDWALEHRSLVWYLMLACAGGRPRLHRAWPRGGPVLHHQDHGDRGQVARRHRRGNDRNQVTDRIEKKLEELDYARLHPQLDHAGPDRRSIVNLQGHAQKPRRAGRSGYQVRNMINDIKHGAAARRAGAVLQRRVRRRVRQCLCVHRGRAQQRAAARLCRGRARRRCSRCRMSARSS